MAMHKVKQYPKCPWCKSRVATSSKEKAAWRQGFVAGGAVALKAMQKKIREVLSDDVAQDVRLAIIDALLKTKLGK